MSSMDVSKSIYTHSCDKYRSTGAIDTLPTESNSSRRISDVPIDGNSYVNTPSPSSIASSNTIEHALRHRPFSFKNDHHGQLFSKRRYRNNRLLHQTHSLSRQYIITMTNILFQMQKEIYKLKRRANRVEHILLKQIQVGHPIIRIPRLTRAELAAVSMNENDESDKNATPKSIVTTERNPSDKPQETQIVVTIEPKQQENTQSNDEQPATVKVKYCSICEHEYSTRSAYLQHMRKFHQGKSPHTTDEVNHPIEEENFNNEANHVNSVQSVICSDVESEPAAQLLVNHWDFGEGRLRPRRLSKVNSEPINKVKCDICKKFFRATYLTKHKRRAHGKRLSSSPNEINEPVHQIESAPDQPTYETISNADECAINETNDPPSALTIADMDVDDMPIQFCADSSKAIVIATTCLEHYQLEMVEQFLEKFSSRVSQTTTIDSDTTHLITNDNKRELRSPLTLKLVEAIAHHCYCVSFRWIIDCVRYDRIVDENAFEIEGDDIETHPHGGPQRSRLTQQHYSLFQNTCFMIKCTDNSDNKMTNDRLKSLITTCGGQIINCVTQRLLDAFAIVVLCDKLYVSERRHNYDQCRSLGIRFLSSNWVVQSILEYRQKPFLPYEETPS